MDRRARLARSHLYFISDGRPGDRPLADVLAPALAGGVDVFQLRAKGAGDSELLRLARTARSLCDEAGALFIINDRPDLVAATGADGVHVGQADESIAAARATVGPEPLIGISTHAPGDLARSDGADYAGVGPIHETPTKPGRAAAGLDYVRHAAGAGGSPFFAIGGIDAGNVGEVLDAGATRIAVVRAIALADDPEAAARTLRAALDQRVADGAR